jgi:hypothetical protein
LPKEIIIIFQNHVKIEIKVFFIKKQIECQTKNSKKKKENKNKNMKRSHPTSNPL